MPLVIPPGFAHVALQFRHTGDPDPWYITFGVDSSAPAGDVSAIGLTAMRAFWEGFGTLMSSGLNMTGCEVTVGQDAADPVRGFVANDVVYEGGEGEPMLPQNCALLIRKNSVLGGRRHQGRFFIPGCLREGQVDNVGNIDTADVTLFSDAAVTFHAWLASPAPIPGDDPIPMFLLHSDGISDTPDPTEVSALSVDNVISTQRRRLR